MIHNIDTLFDYPIYLIAELEGERGSFCIDSCKSETRRDRYIVNSTKCSCLSFAKVGPLCKHQKMLRQDFSWWFESVGPESAIHALIRVSEHFNLGGPRYDWDLIPEIVKNLVIPIRGLCVYSIVGTMCFESGKLAVMLVQG